jgi:hypothetical protein
MSISQNGHPLRERTPVTSMRRCRRADRHQHLPRGLSNGEEESSPGSGPRRSPSRPIYPASGATSARSMPVTVAGPRRHSTGFRGSLRNSIVNRS